jgi:tetratricopeptide (TPR) repeat protein
LREEKQYLEQENAQLRTRLRALEEEVQRLQEGRENYTPNLDGLLQQLDTIQQVEQERRTSPPSNPMEQERRTSPPSNPQAPAARSLPDVDDYAHMGELHEQQGQFEQAIQSYRKALEVHPDNLDVAQQLAFLLEKLNRDAEASPLWDKIWAMREAQSQNKRLRSR